MRLERWWASPYDPGVPGPAPTATSLPTDALPRRLSLPSTIALVIGIIVGSGIFRAPSSVAEATGSATGIALVWIVGGLVTLCLALCVAELGTMFPRAGGAYVYLKESWGPPASFAYGWTYLLLITPSAWATISLVFAEYTGAFVALDPTDVRIVATALIAFVTIANVFSVRFAIGIQNLATSAKVFALAAIIAVLFGMGGGAHAALGTGASTTHALTISGFVVGLVTALWAYDGIVPASSAFEEVRDPARTLPRALLVGVLIVTILYVGLNAAFVYVLPVAEVATSTLVGADAMRVVAGETGASIVAAAVILTTFGCMAATAMCDPRVIFAMARDGQFFHAVGRVHPRFETPYVAVLICGALSIVWVWVRTLEQLAAQTVLGVWPFFVLMIIGLMRLRASKPQIARPYRVPLYPLLPLAFLAASLVLLAGSFIELPQVSLINAAIIGLAFPAYFGWRKLREL